MAFWEVFSCGTRRVVPSGQDSSILPARVANHSAGLDSSCPAHGASHIIRVLQVDTIYLTAVGVRPPVQRGSV